MDYFCQAPLVTRHPRRMLAFFEQSRLIKDQHGLRRLTRGSITEGRTSFTEGIGVPPRPSQQRLDPIRGSLRR